MIIQEDNEKSIDDTLEYRDGANCWYNFFIYFVFILPVIGSMAYMYYKKRKEEKIVLANYKKNYFN